jgi:hypothetical protein
MTFAPTNRSKVEKYIHPLSAPAKFRRALLFASTSHDFAGGSHDQTDAEWIVIRTELWGHNDTPFGRPAPGRPSGRPGSGRPSGIFCMFELL